LPTESLGEEDLSQPLHTYLFAVLQVVLVVSSGSGLSAEQEVGRGTAWREVEFSLTNSHRMWGTKHSASWSSSEEQEAASWEKLKEGRHACVVVGT